MITQSMVAQSASPSRGISTNATSKGRADKCFDLIFSDSINAPKSSSNRYDNKPPSSEIRKTSSRNNDRDSIKDKQSHKDNTKLKDNSEAKDSANVKDSADYSRKGKDVRDKVKDRDKEEDLASGDIYDNVWALGEVNVMVQELLENGMKYSTDGMYEEQEGIVPGVYEALQDRLSEMSDTISEAVRNALNLTVDEFQQLLNEKGLSCTDLTSQDTLKQFVLSANGKSDVTDFLLDDKLADIMKMLTQEVASIMDDYGINDEHIKTIIASDKDVVVDINEKGNMQDNGKASDYVKEGDAELDNSYKAEADKNDSLMGEESHEEKGHSKFDQEFNSFLDRISDAYLGNTRMDYSTEAVYQTKIREIAGQIIEQIKVIVKPGQTSMELSLNPEHLGRVVLKVQEKDGLMTAHFRVDNEMAKEAIEGQMYTLKETLSNQGIKVDTIDVSVESNISQSYTSNQEGETSNDEDTKNSKSHQTSRITLEEAQSMTEDYEETSVKDYTGLRGNVFDYTA